jgi:hypothetical protein
MDLIDEQEERRKKRFRQRLAIWAAFLLVGLSLGIIWATGFASTGGTTGTINGPGSGLSSAPGANEDNSNLANKIVSNGNLVWNWQGRWGSIDSKAMYEVDLDTLSASDEYFVSVLLTDVPSGFSDLQLQLRIADVGAGGTCNATAIDAASPSSNYRLMIFDTNDAQVTFAGMGGSNTGLPGASTYCIGISDYAGSGKDEAGTFIRRSTGGSFSGDYPEFVATLNQM